MRAYRYIDALTALFVTSLLLSNIASSAKIIDWGVSVWGLRLAFDAGTLLFPVSYILGDVLTEVYGYARARRVIWIGFGCAALMGALLWIVARLPGEAQWQQYAGDDAYNAILGSVGNGAIIVASLLAYLFGAFSNSVILAKMKVWTRGRKLWTRTIGSTLIGQALDTGLFVLIAAAFGVFPWSLVLSLIVANYVFKVGIEAVLTPVTYIVVGILKRAEREDYYDRTTDFTPFCIS
ncbi:MAG: queuosine precursor transporter [Candidatus Peribacteraceae bacterium]|nr:queuosine precursor transporter [Candidatus Peribacteria bacterium]